MKDAFLGRSMTNDPFVMLRPWSSTRTGMPRGSRPSRQCRCCPTGRPAPMVVEAFSFQSSEATAADAGCPGLGAARVLTDQRAATVKTRPK